MNIFKGNMYITKTDIAPYNIGALKNLSFAIKDVIDLKDFLTTCGNSFVSAKKSKSNFNAVCVDILLSHGASCVGKTNLGELGCGLTGINNFYGTPINPKLPTILPGGSSSGSACAVAAGDVDFALGTDTGGSIRLPASYCGIYGMRPSTHRISMAGIESWSYTFDAVGVLARNLNILTTTMAILLSETSTKLTDFLGNIFVIKDFIESADSHTKNAFEKALIMLKSTLKDKIKDVYLADIYPNANHPIEGFSSIFRTVLTSEMCNTLGKFVDEYKLEFGKSTFVNIERIKNTERTQISFAYSKLSEMQIKINEFLLPNNYFCLPTAPHIAPKLENNTENSITYKDFRPFFSIAGIGRLPQISIPLKSHIPVGFSLIGANGKDMELLTLIDYIFQSCKKINFVNKE